MRQLPALSPFWWKLIGSVFACLFLMVLQHVEARRLEREVKLLQRDVDRLTYENGRLRSQVHLRTSLSALDAAARKDFGMEPPDAKHVVGITPP